MSTGKSIVERVVYQFAIFRSAAVPAAAIGNDQALGILVAYLVGGARFLTSRPWLAKAQRRRLARMLAPPKKQTDTLPSRVRSRPVAWQSSNLHLFSPDPFPQASMSDSREIRTNKFMSGQDGGIESSILQPQETGLPSARFLVQGG
jgi:hypothetical protein